MRRCIVSGSFGPLTKGHCDIIERALKMFDEVVVAVGNNIEKDGVSADKRVNMVKKVYAENKNIKVCEFSGLLVDFAKSENISVIVKGVRDRADLQYEADMARANKELGQVETVFLLCNDKYQHVSSSFVRELVSFNANIKEYVPEIIIDDVNSIYKKKIN